MPPKRAQAKSGGVRQPQPQSRHPRSSASSSSSAASSIPRVSLASALYADVVHSMFGFLSLRDLASASASCKWWRSCLQSLPKGEGPALTSLHFGSLAFAVIPGLCASPLSHRVTSLTITRPLSLSQFHALSAMASVLRMDVWMGGAENAGQPAPRAKYALLPPALTSLNLRFGDGLIQPRIIAAAGESQTLRHLGLLLVPYTNHWFSDLDLSPLRATRSLTALQLDPAPSDDQLAALKSIATLHRFLVPRDYWFVSQLWQGLKMDLHHVESKAAGVDGSIVHTLAQHAPNLTQLPSGHFFHDALPVLSALKTLKLLRMQPGLAAQHRGDSDRNARFDGKEVVDAMLPCAFLPRLELLCLERLDGLSSAQMLTISPQLSSLLVLQLSSVAIDSLSFVSDLCALRQLHLIAATDGMPVSELSAAMQLPQLERMHIAQSKWDRDAVMRIVQPRLAQMRCFSFDGPDLSPVCPRDANPLHDLNPDECQMTVPTRDRDDEL